MNRKELMSVWLKSRKSLYANLETDWQEGFANTPAVPQKVVEIVNSITNLEPTEVFSTPCLAWKVQIESDKAEGFLNDIRGILQAYPVTPHLSFEIKHDSEYTWAYAAYDLEIAPSINKFDLIRFHLVDGPNYDISVEDVIHELMLLDRQFGVDFVTSSSVRFKRTPTEDELPALLSWYDKFCPDSSEGLSYEGASHKENLSNGLLSFGWD